MLMNFYSHFNLETNPFADTINPSFFFKTPAHEDAFYKMMMCIEHDISLGMIVGQSGTGKTLLSQMLLTSLDQSKYQAALVLVTPGMSRVFLLREILKELGIALDEKRLFTHDLIALLQDEVIKQYKNGKKVVIIIDEAHFLDADALHILRTISNIEIPEKKLVTCILFAETKLAARLKHPSYDSLRTRMYITAQLAPLSERDAAQYIKFRLLIAGGNEALFDEDVFSVISSSTKGIVRDINKLANNALLRAWRDKKSAIDKECIERVMSETVI